MHQVGTDSTLDLGETVIEVYVIGFPNTGTSITYHLLTLCFQGRDYVFVFEPLNYDVREVLHMGGKVNPIDIIDNSRELGKLYLKILERGKSVNILPRDVDTFWRNCMEIVEELDRVGKKVIVKDVVVWPLVKQLVEKLRNTKFVLMRYDVNRVVNSILRLEKKGVEEIPKLFNEFESSWRVYGRRIFWAYIGLKTLSIDIKPTSREEITKLLEVAYKTYEKLIDEVVHEFGKSGRVHVVDFVELRKNPRSVLTRLSRFVNCDLARFAELIKPL